MIVVSEPWEIVFDHMYTQSSGQIQSRSIDRQRAERRSFYSSGEGEEFEITRERLLIYLELVEGKLAAILATHSPYYWMYLCRRMPMHNAYDRNPKTLADVRKTLDIAILKFSNLEVHTDICRNDEMSFEEFWGGQLISALANDLRVLFVFRRAFAEMPSQLGPRQFERDTFIQLFELQGWAFEHRLCLARMRSIGKGRRLIFSKSKGDSAYLPNPEIEETIRRHDLRKRGGDHDASLIGTVYDIQGPETDLRHTFFNLVYNPTNLSVSPFVEALGLPKMNEVTTFLPISLSVHNFLKAHAFAADTFKNAFGYSLSAFVHVLWALQQAAIFPVSMYVAGRPARLTEFLRQALKRGYASYHEHDFGQTVKEQLSNVRGLEGDSLDEVMQAVPAIMDDLTLTERTQDALTLWSRGPRPVVIPTGNGFVVDIAGGADIQERLFSKIHMSGQSDPGENNDIRGKDFEREVRVKAGAIVGADLLRLRRVRVPKSRDVKHEFDLLIKIGTVLYVCECFSKTMPLDMTRGDPEFVVNRLEGSRKRKGLDGSRKRNGLNAKLEQARKCCTFLSQTKVGNGYDFSDVTEFVPIVVSPFVEWLPSISEEYWLSEKWPRVMSSNEFCRFLGEAKAARGSPASA